ncbi:hypothetical protein [Malaciobacter marinus]|jgi:hypothetical protein|uniref:DUF2726 domain-containing protein n=1 Tax=Malaciobacter marinus TaxID=505249 RepID=A0AB37A0N1_9BACT|nr:hypothetical protein [Malaciobacter marinus]PPK62105.1 hypothetical protein B0F89_10538 [Malaciobacter marinus]SKB28039.1 hypothetical protein SAMN06295997_10353 [Malaciobacter marinus]
MQYFGVFKTKYEEVFLTESYLYISCDKDDEITVKDLKEKIKTNKLKKKNIIGTIFLYNPIVSPVGYDSNKFLLEQEFDKFDEMIELKIETYMTVFKNAMSKTDEIKGKLIQVRNLFNLNEKNIDSSQLLMKFNDDLEKYNSLQNTEFDRDIMYLDAQNLIPSGKFVFFSWGEKINAKEFIYIDDYARLIYENCKKLGKKIAFVYKEEKSLEGAEQLLQFATPMQNIKTKNSITSAINESFKEFPPKISPYK